MDTLPLSVTRFHELFVTDLPPRERALQLLFQCSHSPQDDCCTHRHLYSSVFKTLYPTVHCSLHCNIQFFLHGTHTTVNLMSRNIFYCEKLNDGTYVTFSLMSISLARFFTHTTQNKPFFTKLSIHTNYTFTKNMCTSVSLQCYHKERTKQ